MRASKHDLEESLQALHEVEKTIITSIKESPDDEGYISHLAGVQKMIEERKKQLEEYE